ncbi:hypothetical protein DPMN_192949 [Dreissena polymorpha]|uniref:Uncharacterized protein n=1 Tax=Dreissena polymorpha TaxID=45954 RepID=A0A9D4BED3_DREPO|nr:hypothetical protein DPMN_192949 [Dreissena polymorpha]
MAHRRRPLSSDARDDIVKAVAELETDDSQILPTSGPPPTHHCIQCCRSSISSSKVAAVVEEGGVVVVVVVLTIGFPFTTWSVNRAIAVGPKWKKYQSTEMLDS